MVVCCCFIALNIKQLTRQSTGQITAWLLLLRRYFSQVLFAHYCGVICLRIIEHLRYIDVHWKHESNAYPIRLVSEVGTDNFEIRKLEFFSNGTVGYATEMHNSKATELGIDIVPNIEEINSDPIFTGKVISKLEFDKLWNKYVVNGI